MSRAGNCYDNAAIESFWGTYKQELVYPEHFEKQSKEEVKLATFKYIELYYNRTRRHSALGYTSPEQYPSGINLRRRLHSLTSPRPPFVGNPRQGLTRGGDSVQILGRQEAASRIGARACRAGAGRRLVGDDVAIGG